MAVGGHPAELGLHPAARTLLIVLSLLGLLVAAWLVFDPSDATTHHAVVKTEWWLRMHGVPFDIATAALVEFVLNVAFFMPVGFVAALLTRRHPVWVWALVGVAISGTIELVQLIALPGRHASLKDVVSNTLGLLLGVGVVRLARRALPHVVA
jgi:glycopeptide antibiotics resistance protein